MKRSCTIFVLFCGLLAVCSGIGGCASIAPPPPESVFVSQDLDSLSGSPLTVDQAVVRALAYDPDLRAARYRISAAYWRKVQIALPANPRLAVSLDPLEWVLRLSARITDLLDLGGQRRAETRAARSRQEQAALEVRQRQIELVCEVRFAFFETAVHGEMARLQQRRVEVLEELVAVALAQIDMGEMTRLEALQRENQLLEARMAARDQELSRRQSAARLNRRLGMPPAAEIELALPADPLAVRSSADGDSTIVDLGLLRRPELALIAARAGEHRALLRVARVTWLDAEAGPHLKRSHGPTVGGGHVALTLPIFDRGQAQRGVQASLLAALEQQMLAVQAALLLEVHAAWWTLRREEQRYQVELPALRAQVSEKHALLQQMGELGAASAVDVQLARLEILDADLLLARGRLSWLRAQAALAAAIGDSGEGTGDGGEADEHNSLFGAMQGCGHDGQA